MTDVCGSRNNVENLAEDSLFKHIIVRIGDKKSVLNGYNTAQKLKMSFEKFRLESFINWPVPFISPKTLANNGFYYLGIGDRIRCNFCDIQIHEFKAEDIPSVEHQKFSPNCPFLSNSCNTAKCGNIPLIKNIQEYGVFGSNMMDNSERISYSCCCCGNTNKTASKTNKENVAKDKGIQTNRSFSITPPSLGPKSIIPKGDTVDNINKN